MVLGSFRNKILISNSSGDCEYFEAHLDNRLGGVCIGTSHNKIKIKRVSMCKRAETETETKINGAMVHFIAVAQIRNKCKFMHNNSQTDRSICRLGTFLNALNVCVCI